jgi:hypothetical protein
MYGGARQRKAFSCGCSPTPQPSWAFSVKKTPLHNCSGNPSNRENASNHLRGADGFRFRLQTVWASGVQSGRMSCVVKLAVLKLFGQMKPQAIMDCFFLQREAFIPFNSHYRNRMIFLGVKR